ncbi:conserved hypothetical protein [Neospora caninum Liverpool]|uniref:Uncharacterized protein n=1 Tax=Neospora caninum (strain Liverpool) TaxID=572307 RepID=F0VQE8_NEOCL|nr:conserved hypothetical protein [Neospora caninum Liverpool]CBZ55945.1 conserved hypothetical protein [Neospora caninum Liverpool]CEL70691.1 TPA: hypothetical protein BN1204_063710 [Neospora caninum Liverpool]|eukprot:XP_003885971.1 conserved hypothetical protein [Neospora caninum Liverpool]
MSAAVPGPASGPKRAQTNKMEVPPAPPSSPLVQRKRRLDLPTSSAAVSPSPLKKKMVKSPLVSREGMQDESPRASSGSPTGAAFNGRDTSCAGSVRSPSPLGKSESSSENDPFLIQSQKQNATRSAAATHLASLVVDGKMISPPPPLAVRTASPALLRRVPPASLTPGNFLSSSTASLPEEANGAGYLDTASGVDHVATLASRVPPFFPSGARDSNDRNEPGEVGTGATLALRPSPADPASAPTSPLRLRRPAVVPVVGASDGAHASPAAAVRVRGEGTPQRVHHILGTASAAASPVDVRDELGRSRTPPRRGAEPEPSRDSLSRLDSVLPATPPRLPSAVFYEQLGGRTQSPRQSPAPSSLAPSLQQVLGEGTPLGGTRRPRDSFEFALADEAATPSPFSRSKRRNRGEESSLLRDSAGMDAGDRRPETTERRDAPEMETQSPFRRSPITGKRQCVVSPLRLTPARQSPACFRDDRRGRTGGPGEDQKGASCPSWLVKNLAGATPSFFRSEALRVGGSAATPTRLSQGGEDAAAACPHFLGSLLALSDMASREEHGDDGLGSSQTGRVRERINSLLHAVSSLKLDALENLFLGKELERLWRHFRTLRIVCDREHDASRHLGLASKIFPAFQRLTHNAHASSTGAASILATSPSCVATAAPTASLSGEGNKPPTSEALNGAQPPTTRQLDIDDIARMLWLAPHLLAWRYRQLKTPPGTSPRLAMGSAALTTSPLSRRLRPAGAEGEDEQTAASPLRRSLVLVSGDRLADGMELELLEFVLTPAEAQTASVRLPKQEAAVAGRQTGDMEGLPQVVLMSREMNPSMRLIQFRSVLVLWVFLWQLEYLKTGDSCSDVSRLPAVFEKAWQFLTRGQWVPGFNPDTAPLPPCHVLPPRPVKTLLRSPSKGGIGRDRGVGAAEVISPQKPAVSTSLLKSSPVTSAMCGSPGAFLSPLSRRRLVGASPLGSPGLFSASTPTGGDEKGAGRSSRDGLGAAAQSEAERLVYRLSGADTRLSTSSVSSRMSADSSAPAPTSGVSTARVGSPLSAVSKSPQTQSPSLQTAPRRDSNADISSPASSVRSPSAGGSPISERLRQRTEARRQARLQQEELRKQRAGLHQEARQWTNVRWVLSCLLDACVYRDPRKTIDTRVFVDMYISKSKLPLRLDVVEECLATLAGLAPDMLSLNGSVVAFASRLDAAALLKLVDARVAEAQKAAAAFDKGL